MFHSQGPSLWELTRQALSSTQRGYDLLAPKFDFTPFRTPDAVIKATVDQIGTAHDALDLCCGTGAALPFLRSVCDGQVVGVDFSKGMLAQARKRHGDLDVALEEADALALPYSAQFDAVVCLGALGHIQPEDHHHFVENVWASLRPSGRFVFATTEHPPVLSRPHLQARTFNAVMRLRNAIWRPPFIMYYLMFLLPDCLTLLGGLGFRVEVIDPRLPSALRPVRIVRATKC